MYSNFRRKLLFSALYFSEGAPIGFLWWALPSKLKAAGLSLTEITQLAALLVLPWAFKFLWAPLIDALQFPRWTLRHWITACQLAMGLALLPIFGVDYNEQFETLRICLLIHAFFAASQDVSIDALCISLTDPEERGRYNGWMQAGMLAGRSLLGGGALIMFSRLGGDFVMGLLLTATLFSASLLWLLPEGRPRPVERSHLSLNSAWREMGLSLKLAFQERTTWLAVAFALVAGAAFEAMGAIQGPCLVDQGLTQQQIGWIFAVPYVAYLAFGSVLGGYLSDQFGKRRIVIASLLGFTGTVAVAAFVMSRPSPDLNLLFGLICNNALCIGVFTAASYALFMDLSHPSVAGTQFSTYMGATNGCEAWSAFAIGAMSSQVGVGGGLFALCGASLLSLLILIGLKTDVREV